MEKALHRLVAYYRLEPRTAGLPNRHLSAHYGTTIMDDTSAPKLSPLNVLIDATLTAAAFALFFWLATTHVPSEDPRQVALWSAFCATCMTGVFWIAWQMLKSVYRHQRAAARTSE